MARTNVYAGGTLDRLSGHRGDAAWIAARRADPESRYVVVWRSRCLVRDGEPPHIALLDHAAAEPVTDGAVEVALLGVDGGTAYFAVGLPASMDDPTEGPLAGIGAFEDLRAVGGRLTAPEAAMLALSRGIMYWHERHLFCGVCGSPTESRDAGYIRHCTNDACAAQHFPRTDPAVIMAVSDGDHCLLGRGRDWPEGQYSTLAGFAEPGESLEEAVAREVAEESGVRVRNVRYHSSQPWPFPGSIMLGFHAEAVTTEVTINYNELEDARWFHRDELLKPRDGFRLPRTESIARRLVEDWLSGAIEE